MPISIFANRERGLGVDGVRGIAVLGLLAALSYLAGKGNQLAVGALIPLAKDLLTEYFKSREADRNGGIRREEITVAAHPVVDK